MTTNARIVLALAAAAGLLTVAPAGAQTPSPARLATIQAKRVLSKITGTVRAEPVGKRTRVTVTFAAPGPSVPQALTLMNGAQCTDRLNRSATLISLNPPQGRVSSTIVNVPFSAFQSGAYAVDIRNATNNASLEEACARF